MPERRDHLLRIDFHERSRKLNLAVPAKDFARVQEELKRLAAGALDVPHGFLMEVSGACVAFMSVKAIQAVHCISDREHAAADVQPDGLSGIEGAAFYLRRREEPISVTPAERGPVSDMLLELTDTEYRESPEGCVALPDAGGDLLFLRPDDIDFAFVDARYMGAYQPDEAG